MKTYDVAPSRHGGGEGPARDRWLLSYADLVTLLLAFFVVMYSVSVINEQKLSALEASWEAMFDERGGAIPVASDPEPVDTMPDGAALEAMAQEPGVEVAVGTEWATISLDASVLFDSGNAEPGDRGRTLLGKLGSTLAAVSEVRVEGHTDSTPIATATIASNWELSALRATAVVRLLADAGVDPSHLSATGYGSTRPIGPNDTVTGRQANRRVILKVPAGEAQALAAAPPVDLKADEQVDMQVRDLDPVPGEAVDPLDALGPDELRGLLRGLEAAGGVPVEAVVPLDLPPGLRSERSGSGLLITGDPGAAGGAN